MVKDDEALQLVKRLVRRVDDFPKQGIVFRDIMPIFQNPLAVEQLISHLISHIISACLPVDHVIAIDARGFLLGPLIAQRLHCSFIPARKRGKLPGPVASSSYEKEYGVDSVEIQHGVIAAGQRCIIVDDLIATGGTARASELVAQMKGVVVEYVFLIELIDLKGRDLLNAPIFAPLQY